MANAVHKGGPRMLFEVHFVFLRTLLTVIQSVKPAADKTKLREKWNFRHTFSKAAFPSPLG